ncbi:MAG: hypothetical protein VB878_16770 [Pirellulaceae bacterium]
MRIYATYKHKVEKRIFRYRWISKLFKQASSSRTSSTTVLVAAVFMVQVLFADVSNPKQDSPKVLFSSIPTGFLAMLAFTLAFNGATVRQSLGQ